MSPTALTTAFLTTQFFLLVVVYAGILALRAGERTFSALSKNPRPATKNLPSLVLGFALMTLAFLAFSQDFILLSRPAFGDVEFPALPREEAFLVVFMLNIFGSGLLMGITGGSRDSPFAPVLFVLPALAIFLRESPTRFFLYTGIAVLLFLIFPKPNEAGNAVLENPKRLFAFQVVTLGCLAVSSLVGYATRPL